MSDIKNYDQLKANINYYAEAESGLLSSTLSAAHEAISSLITTIESQKEEIETGIAVHIEYMHTNKRLAEQIESLKAITELAVNALKEELQAAKLWDMDGTVRNIQAVLSEIERLSHELDK